jgi:hypothetical protein
MHRFDITYILSFMCMSHTSAETLWLLTSWVYKKVHGSKFIEKACQDTHTAKEKDQK